MVTSSKWLAYGFVLPTLKGFPKIGMFLEHHVPHENGHRLS
jgi:hypothetical protein